MFPVIIAIVVTAFISLLVLHRLKVNKLLDRIKKLEAQARDKTQTIAESDRSDEISVGNTDSNMSLILDSPQAISASLQANAAAKSHDSLDEDDDKPLILLIDDNQDTLKLLQSILSFQFRCMISTNGHSGLNKAKEYLPDLVISDVTMPELDGFEVLSSLKSDPMTSYIPVMLLTSKSDEQSHALGWENNADEYIEKPFYAQELISRIESLLAIRDLMHGRYQQEFVSLVEDQPNDSPLVGDELEGEIDELADEDKMLNTVAHSFIDQLNAAMDKHYQNDAFDVALLAEELNMSSRQLYRKTKNLLDLTPKESIRRFRLKKAAELLMQGFAPGDVAYKVGFASHSYFSQCFKAQFNCSPSSFS